MTAPSLPPGPPSAAIPLTDEWLRDALDAILSFAISVRSDVFEGSEHAELFVVALPVLRRLLAFRVVGMLALDDDGLGFSLAACDPPSRRDELAAEVARLEGDGSFAWAVYQNRPVLLPIPSYARLTVLHSLSTRSGVHGAIVGIVGDALIPDVAQKLLSMIAFESATVLELGALYRKVSDANRDLEAKVEARTRELSAALVSARAGEKAKGSFLANMSHELRTPLNAVLGMTNLLLETPLDAVQVDYAETVKTAGSNLLRLVDDILDFSKAEEGRLALEVLDFDLRRCVEEALDIVAERAQSKGLELYLRMGPEVPSLVRGDAGRLRQVLLNLLSNAVKFTASGEVDVAVTVDAVRPGRVTFRFAVRDTGIGVTSEQIEQLFQPFMQADVSTTRKFGGTGLGLSICKRIAEMMDGAIGVESAIGAGSVFWFTAELDLVGAGLPELPGLSGRRGLVVVRHPGQREQIADHLRATGMDVLEAETGSAALDLSYELAREGMPLELLVVEDAGRDVEGALLAQQIGGAFPAQPISTVLLVPITRTDRGARTGHASLAYVSMPLHRSALLGSVVELVTPDAPSTLRASRDRDEARPLEPKHILLAEDNPVNQKLAVALLKKLGCTVDVVGDGMEAVEAALTRSFDLVLMDCQMPELDGYGASEQIRALEAPGVHIPIVALTANAMAGDREKCLAAGMDDYITKPIERDALVRILRTY